MVLTNEPAPPVPIQFGENMRITVAANQGGRKYMEDRCVVHTERSGDGTLQWTYVGVYDGHGGEHASEYVRRHLLMNITKNAKFDSDDDEDILEAIRQGFLMTHEAMRHVQQDWPYTTSGFPSTAGTTVSCVFIRNGKLYTGHVGDSAIYLGTVENGALRSKAITTDHKPESANEQLRIAKAGGETAVKSGVTRVVWKRESRMNQLLKNPPNPPVMDCIPFLSVARSLGDLWSYNPETNMFIVSPEPDLAVHRLTGNDFCLVLASDGMTNVLTGEQALSIVFREEELVEINEEINRNHARCVLRTALGKWRTLRADNITVATVIFDIDPLSFTENEMLMKVGKYVHVSQVLTDRPDAMLKISRTDNVLLSTQRCAIMYNGSKDDNYCKIKYSGPGFRSHEEEIAEERKHLMSKYNTTSPIAIGKGSIDARRGRPVEEKGDSDEDDVDDEEEDEGEDDGFDPAEEINLGLKFMGKTVQLAKSPQRPSRPHAPRPVFVDDDSILEDIERDASQPSTSSASITPPRTIENAVKRVKAEAVRRLRPPKINADAAPTSSPNASTSPSDSSFITPDRRVTRSASRSAMATTTPMLINESPIKSTPPLYMYSPTNPRGTCIGINRNLTINAKLGPPISTLIVPTTTPRRSTRLQNNGEVEAVTPASAKLTASRKRPRTMEIAMSGVTPVVAGLSLQDRLPQPIVIPLQRIPPLPMPVFTPSRSAPSSPKKASTALKTSKYSLSKLDEQKKKMLKNDDGVIRESEIADDDGDDVMIEPPSKIRRFCGYVKKIFWGK